MKIAYVISYFQPIFGYSEYYLLHEFQKKGNEVCIITSDRYYRNAQMFDKKLKRNIGAGKFYEHGILVYRLPMLFEFKIPILNFFNLYGILNDFKPQIIHIDSLYDFSIFPFVIYKNKFGYKLFINSISGTFMPSKMFYYLNNLLKPFLSSFLRKHFNRFFAICEGSKRWLIKNFHIEENLIDIIPLGADTELFKPDKNIHNKMRSCYSLNDDFVIIYSGKLLPEKDLDIIIKSVGILTKKYDRIKIIFVGNGSDFYVKYLKRLAKLYNISEKLILIPTVKRTQLSSFYNASDIAIWPGSPSISIIEAMSTGLPIIICKYHTCRDDAYDTTHLLSNNNGLSFNRGNISDLTYCINFLIENKEIRLKMGINSRILVMNKMDWDKISSQYLVSYNKTINGIFRYNISSSSQSRLLRD